MINRTKGRVLKASQLVWVCSSQLISHSSAKSHLLRTLLIRHCPCLVLSVPGFCFVFLWRFLPFAFTEIHPASWAIPFIIVVGSDSKKYPQKCVRLLCFICLLFIPLGICYIDSCASTAVFPLFLYLFLLLLRNGCPRLLNIISQEMNQSRAIRT